MKLWNESFCLSFWEKPKNKLKQYSILQHLIGRGLFVMICVKSQGGQICTLSVGPPSCHAFPVYTISDIIQNGTNGMQKIYCHQAISLIDHSNRVVRKLLIKL